MPELIRAKRVYEEDTPDDGARVLVERLWPRGFKRERLHADSWLREIAPTAELRMWYAHDLEEWPEFVTRYTSQLDSQPDLVASLLEIARHGPLALLYAAQETEHNSATVLLDYLSKRLKAK
jgi:uncharacterized protein YeaO (DUF488 family)